MLSYFGQRRRLLALIALLVFCLLDFSLTRVQARPEVASIPVATPQPFGYGLVVADANNAAPQTMGFNWIKVFNPVSYSDASILRRVTVSAADLADLPGLGARVAALARTNVAALEIGNEPNLSSEWGAPPDASQYAQVLCAAYAAIKQARPSVIVVSGGLAPTGRVPGRWYDHLGHDGLKQDEREFLKEFITAGGGVCLDALGYNAMGFRANYDAAPDISGGTPETDCASGLCFRSVEKAYEIMKNRGLGGKPIWATEVGWLIDPPAYCKTDPRWPGRIWQIVTPQKQADNLVGAFRYARFNWPWLDALFVFNLDFHAVSYYDECEQMRYYSVENQPAFGALWSMSKNYSRMYLPLLRK